MFVRLFLFFVFFGEAGRPRAFSLIYFVFIGKLYFVVLFEIFYLNRWICCFYFFRGFLNKLEYLWILVGKFYLLP